LYPDYLKSLKDYIAKKHPLLITYGEHVDGYRPIFSHPGEVPVYWANQWTPHPVITLMAPEDRASAYIAKYGASIFESPQIPASQIEVETSEPVDPANPAENIVDNNIATYLSITTPAEEEISINLNLGQVFCVGRIEIMARQGFPQLFPSKVRLEASPDGEQWQTIAQETAYALDETETWKIMSDSPPKAGWARYLRLVGQSREYQPGLYFIQLSEFLVFEGACP